MPQPVSDTVTVRIVDQEKEPKKDEKQSGPIQGRRQGQQGRRGRFGPNHGLPPFVLLTKDGHARSATRIHDRGPTDFTELDGGIVEDLGKNGTLYKINYDNTYHVKYRMTRAATSRAMW